MKTISFIKKFWLFTFYFFITGCAGSCLLPHTPALLNKPVVISIKATQNSINNGIALPVDIIYVSDSDAIRDISPDEWFSPENAMRKKLKRGKEITTLAVVPGFQKEIPVITKEKIKNIIIYADYNNLNGRDGQEIVIDINRWQLYYTILIKENRTTGPLYLKKSCIGCLFL